MRVIMQNFCEHADTGPVGPGASLAMHGALGVIQQCLEPSLKHDQQHQLILCL